MPITPMQNLLDFDAHALAAYLTELGEKPFRARQLMRWIYKDGESDFGAMTDIAAALRDRLAQIACITAPDVMREELSDDGTRKWLLDVGTGNAVEAVYIPEESRGTLCISTQAGCALELLVLLDRQAGFQPQPQCGRDHRPAVVAESGLRCDAMARPVAVPQVATAQAPSARHDGNWKISNVVMMGMGEPLLNFDNTVSALRLMLDDQAYGLSRRRVTVSTSGIVPAMDRLREECPVALAVSLHAPNDSCATNWCRSTGSILSKNCWPPAGATWNARRAISSPSSM